MQLQAFCDRSSMAAVHAIKVIQLQAHENTKLNHMPIHDISTLGRYQKDVSPTVYVWEFISLWGFGEAWDIFGYVGKITETHLQSRVGFLWIYSRYVINPLVTAVWSVFCRVSLGCF